MSVKRLAESKSGLKSTVLGWYSGFALLYVLLAIFLPPNTTTIQTYNLTNTAYHVLMVIIALPLVAVWFAAFYGYLKLAGYASSIARGREGPAFTQLAKGVKWLAWGLPVCANLNALLGAIAHQYHGFATSAIIISHYAFLLVALMAFAAMANGARELANIIGKLPDKPVIRWLLAGVIVLSVAFTYFTEQAAEKTINPYRLPMWLILFTIIIPYLYAWIMGLVAAYQVSAYRRSVSGLLYKRALSLVSVGIILAIVGAILLQYVTVSSGYLRRVNLNGSLLLLYGILVVYSAGFVLMAIGAGRLKRIEEV